MSNFNKNINDVNESNANSSLDLLNANSPGEFFEILNKLENIEKINIDDDPLPDHPPKLLRQTNWSRDLLLPEEEEILYESIADVAINIPADEDHYEMPPVFNCPCCQEFGCFCGRCYDCREITLISDLLTFQDFCQDCYNKNMNDHNNDDDIPQEKRYDSDFYDSD